MLRRTASWFGGFLVVMGLTAGCAKAPVVGVLLPTTGDASTYGESIESGIRLAISEAREMDMLPANFEVVWIDTESDPKKAVEHYKTVVKDRGARIVIGGATSARTMAPAKLAMAPRPSTQSDAKAPMRRGSEVTVPPRMPPGARAWHRRSRGSR